MQKNALKRTIMRRVYYAYALSIAGHPAALHGAFIGALSVALTFFVSIPNVLMNISNITVGQLAEYFYASALNTEIWTLFIIGALVMSVLSLRFRLRSVHKEELQTV